MVGILITYYSPDDIFWMTSNKKELQEMVTELDHKSKKIGLQTNILKTMFMTHENILDGDVTLQIENIKNNSLKSQS